MITEVKQAMYQIFSKLRPIAMEISEWFINIIERPDISTTKHYTGDKKRPLISNAFGSKMVKKYGIDNILFAGILVGIVSILIFLIYVHTSFLPLFFIFAAGMSIVLAVVMFDYYYVVSKCEECGLEFAYEEICDPFITDVRVFDGFETYTKRTYRCIKCGHTKTKVTKYFSADPSMQ